MSRPEAERARALLQRADADLAAVRAIEPRDEVRCLPRTVGRREAAPGGSRSQHGFPRTHPIRFLLDLLDDRGLGPPPDLHGVVELYPFGVQLHYEAPLAEEPLDRAAMRELLERVRSWAAAHVL